MQIFYNGVDITKDITIKKCVYIDNHGGGADSVAVTVDNTSALWGEWQPQRGDTLKIIADKLNTGILYMDSPEQQADSFILNALSVPPTAKEIKSKIWRDVTLFTVCGDIARNNGLTFKPYSIKNYTYKTVTQLEEADLAFLQRICTNEGYVVKVYDNNLIVYSEYEFEQAQTVGTIQPADVQPNYAFKLAPNMVQSVTLKHADINGKLLLHTEQDKNRAGKHEKHIVNVNTIEELKRRCRAYLRAYNRNAITAVFTMALRTSITAGNTVDVKGFKMFDGKYFVYRAYFDLINNTTKFSIRKTLEY